jgi:hypothetical protein
MRNSRMMPYRCYFTVYRHEEQRMRRSIRSKQCDLFAVPATAPLSIAGTMRANLVSLLGALLLEVWSTQRPEVITAEKEQDHEHKNNG